MADGETSRPNTEQGNILLRAIDSRLPSATNNIYFGHVGVLGEWDGTNSSDTAKTFFVYEQGANSGGPQFINPLKWSNITMLRTPYDSFRLNNWLWREEAKPSPILTYSGMLFARFTPEIRKTIQQKADALRNQDQYWIPFPFTKAYVAGGVSSFRCDGLVEYVLEQSVVWESTYSAQIGEGVWRNAQESGITHPRGYVTKGYTISEPGKGPVISNVSATSLGGGGFRVTATANDGSYGSGVKSAWVGYDVFVSSFYILGSATYNVDGPQDIDINVSTAGHNTAKAKLRVFDRAGNVSVTEAFYIDTVPPDAAWVTNANGGNPFAGNAFGDKGCVIFYSTDSSSGVSSLSLNGPSGYSKGPKYFDAGVSTTSWGWGGDFCKLAAGTYTLHVTDLAGNATNFYFLSVSTSMRMLLTSVGPDSPKAKDLVIGESEATNSPLDFRVSAHGNWTQNYADAYVCPQMLVTKIDGETIYCSAYDLGYGCQPSGGCGARARTQISATVASFPFSVVNNSTNTLNVQIDVQGQYSPNGSAVSNVFPSSEGLAPGEQIVGMMTLPDLFVSSFSKSNPDTITVYAPVANITLSSMTSLPTAVESAMVHQALRLSSPKIYEVGIASGIAVFNTTMTIQFHYQDAVNTDTSTLKIYRYTNGSLESVSITNQSVSKDGSGVITAVGWSTHTSLYGAFYSGVDTSSPTTILTTMGSSYTWGGTLFISTDSYVVLTATDALQDGYASGVSTIYYRSSASDDFSVYADSVPLPVGTYFFQYRTSDWAGNLESIKTSTFVVTNRTVTQLSGGLRVSGDMLVGYSTSGARFEVEAGGYSNYVLRVSSPNNTTMAAVDFIGNMGLGMESGDGRLSISSNAAQGDIALQLRSGNSVSSGTSSQIALGYNGESSMRDVIRTAHHSSTVGNHMDFLIWDPAVGSTATLASRDILSLQASAVANRALIHVLPPTTTSQDVELVVSNGVTEGGGIIRCKETVGTSAKGSKDSIRYLTAKDEDRALADIASMQPVRFRYKKQGPKGELLPDPSQLLRRGYIYEDAPASIKVAGGALSIDERIANAEMALKASMRNLEKLQKRFTELQARKKK